MELNSLVKSMKASATLALNQKAKDLSAQGKNIINLTAGEPDFLTPEPICLAAKHAIDEGKHFYSPAAGIPELRQAIAQKSAQDYERPIERDQVMVTCGAKQALFNYFYATLNPGDEVIVIAPYWVTYTELIQLCGAKVIIVEAQEENDFQPQMSQVKAAITDKTRCVVLNSPSNPTGAVYTEDLLKDLTTFLKSYPRIGVLSDDIYSKLYYGDSKTQTVIGRGEGLSFDQLTIVHGVSKTYSMTGWRLGWIIGNKALVKGMTKLQSQLNSGTSTISQWAALEALQGDQLAMLKPMKEAFVKRRALVTSRTRKISKLSCINPQGAFYLFVNIKQIILDDSNAINDDVEFCSHLLEKCHVAVVPGSAFGSPGYFRLSFANSEESLEKAFDEIEKFVHDLK